MNPKLGLCLFVAVSAGLLASCGAESPSVESWTDEEIGKIRSRIWNVSPPADSTNAVSQNVTAQQLGELLFFSVELSANKAVSCASCHDPMLGFSDGKVLSEGLGVTKRHSPQLWNVGYQRWFYWDGRRDSLWSQALSPIEDPNEMGIDRLNALRRVQGDETLLGLYEEVFGELPSIIESELESASPLDVDEHPEWADNWATLTQEAREQIDRAFTNIGKAIAAYEMTIVSGESRFDQYARAVISGDAQGQQAYTEEERLGLRLFIGKARCFFCHTGPRFTDDEFHNLGLSSIEDLGRISAVEAVKSHPFNSLGDYSDDIDGQSAQYTSFLTLSDEQAGQFKTGGLRNIQTSAPYMHDGRFATLREVVEFYSLLPGRVEVGHREDFMVPLLLDAQEIDALVAFLESLSPLARD
jgi:cytochrome c peroxidase